MSAFMRAISCWAIQMVIAIVGACMFLELAAAHNGRHWLSDCIGWGCGGLLALKSVHLFWRAVTVHP